MAGVPGSRRPRAHRMKPYPEAWERHERLRDGSQVFIRPLKPEDAALYPDLFKAISGEDLRLRFFAPIRQYNETFVSKLVAIDYDKAIAFAALDERTGQLLGVVRLHFEDHERGEYAVVVRSHLKGHGLGWLLMQRMIEYARAEGLKEVFGQVLSENVTMLAMCAELGFHIADDPESPGVKLVTLDLQERPAAVGS